MPYRKSSFSSVWEVTSSQSTANLSDPSGECEAGEEVRGEIRREGKEGHDPRYRGRRQHQGDRDPAHLEVPLGAMRGPAVLVPFAGGEMKMTHVVICVDERPELGV